MGNCGHSDLRLHCRFFFVPLHKTQVSFNLNTKRNVNYFQRVYGKCNHVSMNWPVSWFHQFLLQLSSSLIGCDSTWHILQNYFVCNGMSSKAKWYLFRLVPLTRSIASCLWISWLLGHREDKAVFSDPSP